ncbi:hypothetical protein AM24_003 [Acinetobacter phage AM24]|nr:hypothetical protein AM24_003 [Acinetobacter phage AM24]
MHYEEKDNLGQHLSAYIFKLFLGFYLSVCSLRLFSFKNTALMCALLVVTLGMDGK